MNKLDQCYCERTCTMKGTTYREFESWTDGCKNCTCMVWLRFEWRLRNSGVSSDYGVIVIETNNEKMSRCVLGSNNNEVLDKLF